MSSASTVRSSGKFFRFIFVYETSLGVPEDVFEDVKSAHYLKQSS